MNFNRWLALLIIGVLACSSASANTKEFLEQCKRALAITDFSDIEGPQFLAGLDMGYCYGYVRGLSDYATGTEPMTSEQLSSVQSCRPEGVDNRQLAQVIVKFLENNPQFLHLEQTTVAAVALNRAFPCD
ncbi:hypothetical protein LWH94_08890 [Marinobacter sp. G11]|uniref:Rap1a/Tai family immunity protein n=1 Tax=Marinobacter sp. G11 TaxID=2903522 RepID=UPI001E381D87|nr:Rap1a/Tai family immunity protein [Marinobacter sp. G11]MCE0759320.1 hypothetical protein [Marinobacter sp. G11]